MEYRNKIQFCKDVNTDPIYQEYGCGMRCHCFKDVQGNEFLQVTHFPSQRFLRSTRCNHWEEDYALEWIMNATMHLKEVLGLFVNPYDLF